MYNFIILSLYGTSFVEHW